jgi:hypothetical protein
VTLRAARCGGLCGSGLQPWPPGTSSGQVPTAIKDVAKFVRQLTQRAVTYRVYEYQGVFVEGEVQHGKDLIVRTCTTSCGPQRAGVTADGKILFTAGGGEGRGFVFERVSGKVQLSVVWNWIA